MELPSPQLLLCGVLILSEVDEAEGQLAAAAPQVFDGRPVAEMRAFKDRVLAKV